MRRKIISIILCVVMIMMIAGCSSGKDAESSDTGSASKSEDGNSGGSSADSGLINVGIINNDPDESG